MQVNLYHIAVLLAAEATEVEDEELSIDMDNTAQRMAACYGKPDDDFPADVQKLLNFRSGCILH